MTSPRDRVYCTYFDSRYLPRAHAMIDSLRSVGEFGTVYALCFDESALEAVTSWRDRGVVALAVADLEEAFPQLRSVKGDRTDAEYFFTCTPWVLKLVMKKDRRAEWVTYLDADLWFFSSVSPIYAQLTEASCGIIAHDYLPRYRKLEKYGRYNVGWVSFRRDGDGLALLEWWADRCLEWCFDTPEDGKFADQGYLDGFEGVSGRVAVIPNHGANLAPWNLGGRSVSNGEDEGVLVDGEPLIFFHFHGLRRRGDRYIASHLEFGARANETVRERVYGPYVESLVRAESVLGYQPPTSGRRGRGVRGLALQVRRNAYDVLARLRGDAFSASVTHRPVRGKS